MDQVTKIGFFHFGRDHGTPMRALKCELTKRTKEELQGALIVLPEAFNIGRCYHDSTVEASPEPNILEKLKNEVARKYELAIVAGLVLDWKGRQGKKRNSAYLIDGGQIVPLCHKMVPDPMGGYEVCTEGCDENNPKKYGGALVGCLICADSQPPADNQPAWERQGSFKKRVDESPAPIKILCIPAHPHILAGSEIPEVWPHYIVVFASSCGEGNNRGSCIGHKGGTLADAKGEENTVKLVALPHGVVNDTQCASRFR